VQFSYQKNTKTALGVKCNQHVITIMSISVLHRQTHRHTDLHMDRCHQNNTCFSTYMHNYFNSNFSASTGLKHCVWRL